MNICWNAHFTNTHKWHAHCSHPFYHIKLFPLQIQINSRIFLCVFIDIMRICDAIVIWILNHICIYLRIDVCLKPESPFPVAACDVNVTVTLSWAYIFGMCYSNCTVLYPGMRLDLNSVCKIFIVLWGHLKCVWI